MSLEPPANFNIERDIPASSSRKVDFVCVDRHLLELYALPINVDEARQCLSRCNSATVNRISVSAKTKREGETACAVPFQCRRLVVCADDVHMNGVTVREHNFFELVSAFQPCAVQVGDGVAVASGIAEDPDCDPRASEVRAGRNLASVEGAFQLRERFRLVGTGRVLPNGVFRFFRLLLGRAGLCRYRRLPPLLNCSCRTHTARHDDASC